MNKFKFYLLSFTWGLPMTLIGCVVAFILRSAGYVPQKYGYCYHFEVGENWGGVNLGIFILTDVTSSEHTKSHEHGHAIQNCYWGFLFPFVIGLPSAIRYWYREYLVSIKKRAYSELSEYDSLWIEGDATKRGTEFMKSLM